MKKLYFIRANKTKHGGAEVYLSRLSLELDYQNISYSILNSTIPKWLPSWLRVLVFTKKMCLEKNDDTLYFSLERIVCPDIYRAGDGVHKVFIEVENKSRWNPLHVVYVYLEKVCFQNAQKIIANSQMIKNQIIDTYNVPAEKIDVIYNGIKIDTMDLTASRAKLHKEFQIDFTLNKILLYVGSGFKRKGVEEFLTILSQLKFRQFKAFIVGKEKKLSYYQSLVKELNLENKVVFTGPRDDVKDFYAIADIFLFPTRYEPFSNVVLEAMNYENVVITTKQNGANEILDIEYVMAKPDDYSIVEKIDLLLDNDKKLQEIKKRNLEIVKNFSIEKNVEETLKVIHEVID